MEWEAFINSVWRECTQMKNEFLFERRNFVGNTESRKNLFVLIYLTDAAPQFLQKLEIHILKNT
mgnify:CR=1 FL=1